MTALSDAVERDDLELARLLLERGAERDEAALITRARRAIVRFSSCCTRLTFERLVNHSSTSRTPRA